MRRRFVVDKLVTASFDDAAAASELARGCDVVTLEIEKVGSEHGGRVALAPVRPGGACSGSIQDRIRQKQWLDRHGFPVGAFAVADTRQPAAGRRSACARRASSSPRRGGYDGRGAGLPHRPADDAA